MQAIRVREFGEPDVMKVEEAPDLQAGDNQIVVQIQANGVNPVDTYIRSGTYAVKPDLPYTPGSDAAGTVSSIGSGIHHVQVGVGDRRGAAPRAFPQGSQRPIPTCVQVECLGGRAGLGRHAVVG